MNNDYLHELIREVQARQGGIVLNVQGKTEAVVLSIDRYNQLLRKNAVNSQPVSQSRRVLVTGGAGYIGAHVVRQLLAAGHTPVVIDNLSTGTVNNVPSEVPLVKADIREAGRLRETFIKYGIDTVIHLAASVEHEESFRLPLEYLDNNATATDILLRTMTECGVENIVFSSTAAVYGQTDIVPTPEDAPLNPNSPYGYSKALAEQLIRFYADYKGLKAVIFRYFNACGSDFDGQIKNPHSSCLMSAIMDVVVNRKKLFVINGNDYETFDGTCVRDFVHVLDIAKAHVLSLDKIDSLGKYNVYNVGSNHGFSVQQVIQATAEITGHMIPLEIGSRRPGDVASSVADNTKIRQELGFRLGQSDLETMISTAWNSVKA